MSALFQHSTFAGFGPDLRRLGDAVTGEQVEAANRLQLRRAIRERCPARPGVYGMVDDQGELIYVGKAKSLRVRLLSYFRVRSAGGKARRILRRTRRIAWEFVPHELAALIRELELIRKWRPRFNVVGQPDPRKRVYLCLGRAPAPYLYPAMRLTERVLAAWGPVPAGRRTEKALKTLNDLYRLRDCPRPNVPMRFSDQGHLFDPEAAAGCLRWEIGTCVAPCAAACTRRQYGDLTRQLRRFLDGGDSSPFLTLTNRMKECAAAFQFERAGELRDQVESLTWLRQTLERCEQARMELTFVYPVVDSAGVEWWFLIERGQPRTLIQPAALTSTQLRRLLREVYCERPRLGGPNDGHEDRELLWLVASWFRRHPVERTRVLPVDAALKAA